MPLTVIPPDPEPTRRQYRKFLESDMKEPLRSQWAAFEWRWAQRKLRPNHFLVPFADQVANYRGYLDSPLWKSIRAQVLSNAHYECTCCDSKATQVHHRDYRPRVMAGHDLSPLVAICSECHKKIEQVKHDESWNAAEQLLAEMVAAKESRARDGGSAESRGCP
jgi:hypothetical protein